MTNTEAFKEAINIINEKKINNWFEVKPIEAFYMPQRVVWLWLRIDDYFVINSEYPTSYRKLHAWEKKYYENNN